MIPIKSVRRKCLTRNSPRTSPAIPRREPRLTDAELSAPPCQSFDEVKAGQARSDDEGVAKALLRGGATQSVRMARFSGPPKDSSSNRIPSGNSRSSSKVNNE